MLPEPGVLEMNLTLGSSCPTYHLLSIKRPALPFLMLMGSVHRSPASFLTVPYLALQPLQSSSLTALGATAPVATVVAVVAVFAAVAAVAATAEPVTLNWQTTAKPSAGTSSSRHLRPPAGGDPRPDLLDDPRPAQGVRMCDPSRSRVPPVPVPPRPAGHAGAAVPLSETLSDGI